MSDKKRVLVINTGSTTTKVAVYENEDCIIKETIVIDPELTQKAKNCAAQLPERRRGIEEWIKNNNVDMSKIDIIAARGGAYGPYEGGAYKVNELMVNYAKYAPTTVHASSLSCMVGSVLSAEYNIPCVIYDGVYTDEMTDIARTSGWPGFGFNHGSHVLNPRAVARKVAEKQGKKYEEGNYIVAHLGGGISVTTHMGGKIVDYADEYVGAMCPERTGMLPTIDVVKMCFSGKYTEAEMYKKISGQGGLVAYLGTSDGLTIEKMIDSGDEKAKFYHTVMCYHVSKAIAQQAAVLCGKVDAIIFTGSLARDKYIIPYCRERIGFLGPIEVIPGEMEMEALAAGALRVLNGEEQAKEFNVLPEGFSTKEEFDAFVKAQQ